MIFLDANVFLRYLVQPDDQENQIRHASATAIFKAIELGNGEATTSEAVLAEVAFILTSKKHYGLSAGDVATFLAPIIRLRGFRLFRGRKESYLRAAEIWADHPMLGFVDALTAAMVETTDLELATFDTDFDALPNIRHWQSANRAKLDQNGSRNCGVDS